ncbi:V-type immunoglobulin domain-containing suppressor of T-cell activation [Cheilinus undulatus]|uniref:V-type immunoglobulin domain-containing suppressor of T-cell activation n=1 Tax=Cheilinus undulatus TaxID=241271 RepID=UPI001BD55519|nr:V-type immunoglobulin domain-containing suppressor of T-cell activation [Cheilinus undulatus]
MMMEGSARQTGRRENRTRTLLWISWVLLVSVGADGVPSHPASTLSVSAPHQLWTCPEGATAKLECAQSGAASHSTDILRYTWLFTPHSDQHCSGREGPRHTIIGSHPHGDHTLPAGLHFGKTEKSFWMSLQNLTSADQGRYCCLLLDVAQEHGHNAILKKAYSHIILQVAPRRNGSKECTKWDYSPPGGLAPVVVATLACVMALLALPLILLLVYKQRNMHKGRRGQELVRMDSEAPGHENPVFFGESPQTRTRTVSQIMTRQPSETGRHLLSEPGTPLSPPAHGDVFFPTEDTIPESPDLLQV